jgi:branched-chain amino acid transport system permease protein
MDIFLQQIINGLVLGSIYALVALGYTMVYGILGLINFAHGEVVMIGALVSYSVMMVLVPSGLPPVLLALISVLVAAPVCMALAWAIERYAYRPLRHAPKLTPLISAIGVSILLQNLAMMIWGRGYHAFPDILPAIHFDIGGAQITLLQTVTIGLAALTMGILAWMIQRTSLGQAMRATAENPAIAELMGIPVNRIIAHFYYRCRSCCTSGVDGGR